MYSKLLSFMLVVGSLTANAALADADQVPTGIWAPGYVTYKHPRGDLVTRNCDLWVPAMGRGDVKLKCGSMEIATTEFSTRTEEGRKIFTVTFKSVPGAPEGTEAQYRGSYLRGSNKAIYYGDVFSRTAAPDENPWQYAGGFMFSADVHTASSTPE